MSKRLIATAVGVLAIALIVAGCGGSSSDDSTTSTASITKAELIKQGDAICQSGNKEIEAGFEEFAKENGLEENQEPSEAQAAEISETVLLPSIQKQIDAIRALGAPSGEEEEVSKILDTVEEEIEAAEEEPEALITTNTTPFKQGNELAQEYGFKVCGEE